MVSSPGAQILAFSICFIVLTTFFIVCRFVSRRILKDTPWGVDDALILLSYAFCLAICVIGLAFVPVADLQFHTMAELRAHPSSFAVYRKGFFVMETLYLAAITFPRLSVLFLLLRLFKAPATRRAIWVLVGLVVASWVGSQVAVVLQCVPIQGFWDPSVRASCFDEKHFFRFEGIPDILIDLGILIVPLVVVARLNASPARKMGIMLIFFCGNIGMVACLVRMILYFQPQSFSDPTWASVYLTGTTIMEPSMYTIAACLLAMKPLVQVTLDKTVPPRARAATARFFGDRPPTNPNRSVAVSTSDVLTTSDHAAKHHWMPLPSPEISCMFLVDRDLEQTRPVDNDDEAERGRSRVRASSLTGRR